MPSRLVKTVIIGSFSPLRKNINSRHNRLHHPASPQPTLYPIKI